MQTCEPETTEGTEISSFPSRSPPPSLPWAGHTHLHNSYRHKSGLEVCSSVSTASARVCFPPSWPAGTVVTRPWGAWPFRWRSSLRPLKRAREPRPEQTSMMVDAALQDGNSNCERRRGGQENKTTCFFCVEFLLARDQWQRACWMLALRGMEQVGTSMNDIIFPEAFLSTHTYALPVLVVS